jgi:tetratricopeptide (TPR) repeat protein
VVRLRLIVVAALSLATAPNGAQQTGVPELIAAYDRGDFPAFDEGLKRLVSLELFLKELGAATVELPRRTNADARTERTRLTVAAVAVEAAARFVIDGRRDVGLLVEEACTIVRRNRPSEAERVWHRAAIAVLSSGPNRQTLEVHAAHASSRFDDDPHFVLARAVAAELLTFPEPRDGLTLADRDGANPMRLVGLFEAAQKHPSVRAEAAVHLGFTWLRLGRGVDAIKTLGEVERLTDDPYLRHLGFLLLGRARDQLGQDEDAVEAYRRAAAEMPAAQTAAIGLAAALMRTGRLEEADRVAQTAVGGRGDADPWLSYGPGYARHWTALRGRLREATR